MDEPGSRAKKSLTSHSQQPACTHKEHQILTSAEATAFAAHFLVFGLEGIPHKGSQHKFLATCIDVDVEKNVMHACQWGPCLCGRGQNEDDSDSE